jgi:hypothetical protein
VVCPYHGWAFDGEGTLQDVPVRGRGGHSQPDRRAAAQPSASSHPAVCSRPILPLLTPAVHPSPLVCAAGSCQQGRVAQAPPDRLLGR